MLNNENNVGQVRMMKRLTVSVLILNSTELINFTIDDLLVVIMFQIGQSKAVGSSVIN